MDSPSAQSQYELGVRYANGLGVPQDYSKAVALFAQASRQGNSEAQCHLGLCFKDGTGVSQDFVKSVKFFTLSSNQGNATAQYSLGWCYENGLGVPKDLNKAVHFYTLATNQGNSYGQNSLGWCYQNGLGVTKDSIKAVQFYTLAANQGNTEAQINIGRCYENGIGVSKNLTKAAQFYTQSANRGNSYGQYNLGWCYENGLGVAKDVTKAIEMYTHSASQNNADAQISLGLCHEKGIGVPRDLLKAFKLYTLASIQGNPYGQYNLGWCYENGLGTEKDLVKASHFYSLASKKGHQEAIKAFERLGKSMPKQPPPIRSRPSRKPQFQTLPTWGFILDSQKNFEVTKERVGTGGSNGVVFKAKYFGATVAAKTYFAIRDPELYGLDDPVTLKNCIDEMEKELTALYTLQHPNIIRFLGAAFNSFMQPCWILTEYASNGSLADLLNKSPTGLNLQTTLNVTTDVISAILYMHHKQWLHRDIKPANILIDEGHKFKITDFGGSKLFKPNPNRRNTIVGTPGYMAPELMTGAECTAKVDFWSFGVVLLEVMIKQIPQLPIASRMIEASRKALGLHGGRFDSILTGCLQENPEKRYDPLINPMVFRRF